MAVISFIKLFRCQNRIKREISARNSFCGVANENSAVFGTQVASKVATDKTVALFKHFGAWC